MPTRRIVCLSHIVPALPIPSLSHSSPTRPIPLLSRNLPSQPFPPLSRGIWIGQLLPVLICLVGLCFATGLLFRSSTASSDFICPPPILGRPHFPLIHVLPKYKSVVYAMCFLPMPDMTAQLHYCLFGHVVGVL